MSAISVKVDGLPELRTQLRAVDPAIDRATAKRLRAIAADVRAKVRAAMPRRKGTAQLAIVSGLDQVSPYVKMQKTGRFAYVPWLDFGGTLHPVGRRYNTQTRVVMREGRYLYPIAQGEAPKAEAECDAALSEAIKAAGLD